MGLFDDDPRTRRLKADAEAMERLKGSSSIIEFADKGEPAERYIVTFKGKGTIRSDEKADVDLADTHRVEIQLGIDYPRSQPYLKWQTPIYHPNIAVSGAVCLGGYSTNWTPSLTLDQLCEMLWDMIRFANYDTESPYNYRAAQWAKSQTQYEFPLDPRPLRNRSVGTMGSNVINFSSGSKAKVAPVKKTPPKTKRPAPAPQPAPRPTPRPARPAPAGGDDIVFIDDGPSPAPRRVRPKPQPSGDDDILFIE